MITEMPPTVIDDEPVFTNDSQFDQWVGDIMCVEVCPGRDRWHVTIFYNTDGFTEPLTEDMVTGLRSAYDAAHEFIATTTIDRDALYARLVAEWQDRCAALARMYEERDVQREADPFIRQVDDS